MMAKKIRWYWLWATASLLFRLLLIYSTQNLNLSTRPEIAMPLTSLRRLAEGYWLKQSSMSPYSGSMYHGSPLLLYLLGPLTVFRIEGHPTHIMCSLLLVVADFFAALIIRATGQKIQTAYSQRLKSLHLVELVKNSDLPAGDIASLVYLWNPFTVVSCVGLSTSPIENLMVVLTLYGACSVSIKRTLTLICHLGVMGLIFQEAIATAPSNIRLASLF